MKKFCTLLLAAFLFYIPVVAWAQTDTIILATPDQVSVGTATYEVSSVKFRWDASPTITDNEAYVNIGLRGEGGITAAKILTGNDAVAFLADLDAADMPIKNLRKWALQWLVWKGRLQGTLE